MAMNYGQNYGYGQAYNNGFAGNQIGFNQNPVVYGNQPMPQDDNSIMAVFVQGEAGATNYLVRSGTTVMPIDFQAGKFWLKSNTGGIPQRMRHFVFKEIFPEQEQPTEQKNAEGVSRKEFDDLSKTVSVIANNMQKLISELGGASNE